MDYGRPEFGRRSPDDFYGRSRSQTRVEPDPYYSKTMDRNARSRSLDYREGFRDDEPDDRRAFTGPGGGVTIPIRQEGREQRKYDYGRELYVPAIRDERGREVRRGSRDRLERERSWGREPYPPPTDRMRSARSMEWLDRRTPYDDRRSRQVERHSPKSVASSRRINPNLSQEANRPRRIESDFYRPGPADEFRRDGAGYGRERSAGHSRQHQYSYHYDSHGGGASPRRAISQQPTGPPGPSGRYPGRPTQYRRVKICCFTFTWPPWSYETTPPPQPIYKNI